MAATLEALGREVDRFRAWADTYPVEERSGEWEMGYNGWKDLNEAFIAFVSSTSCVDWDAETTQMVLYTIARDNEMQWLIERLAENPNNLLCLAERALESDVWEAKWQIATALGGLESRRTEAESLLLRFAHDEDEYVRRRALLALSDLNSSHVEDLVASAWDTGEEYQRIAVLCALHQVGSPLLKEYAKLAEADGRESLAKYATYIREHGTLSGFTLQGIPVVDR
jgi:HEAT repeat protein